MFSSDVLEQVDEAREEYERRVAEILGGADPDAAPRTTQSGLELKRVYTPDDVADMDFATDLGFPGHFPFTRGVHPTGYLTKDWTRRQVVGMGTAEETNERLRYLLSQGQTGFSVCGMGYQSYDSDDDRAYGFVGRGGVWIDTLADIETLFEGIDMESISINQIAASIPVFAMILSVAQQRGIDISRLRGTIQNTIRPGGEGPSLAGNGSVDIIEFCARNMPLWNHTSISVRNTRDSGCTATQELAFAMYQGNLVLDAATARGLTADQVAPRISFFFSAENDFLEELAKFRAARRMWARLVKERYETDDPRSLLLRFHVQTSAISLTAQQPLNNLIRSTLHALAAALGGALSMSVNSYDEALAIPTEAAATLSLRTQQIIAEESGVTNVLDPLGGSYCIEALTNQLEREAGRIVEQMEEMGDGAARRWMARIVEEEAVRRQREIDEGQRRVVGVNCFTEDEEETGRASISTEKYDPAWHTKQIARLQHARQTRDPNRAEEAGRELAEAYRQRVNIIPAMMNAVQAYLSIGEIAVINRQAQNEPATHGPSHSGG